jgi:hypothetical protein
MRLDPPRLARRDRHKLHALVDVNAYGRAWRGEDTACLARLERAVNQIASGRRDANAP